MNALIVMSIDRKNVEFRFFEICTTTGEHCSEASNDISWENCISVGLDNTNANMGDHNSTKSRVLNHNSACFLAGCNCHLVHLAAG